MRQIVIVDHRVVDGRVLTDSLPHDTRVVLLNAHQDGLSQIVQALAGSRGLQAIHILSHGADGQLLLGAGRLDTFNVEAYAPELASLGASLMAGGELLLYGCEVAHGTRGHRFVEAIARHTGAQVAASTTRTGAAALGGDWDFGFTVGQVTTPAFPDPRSRALYHHVLAAPNPFELSSLTGSNGFKLSGVTSGDMAGMAVSDAGDVNGDGFDDLLVGARYAGPHGTWSGAAYLVFGKATGFTANTNLSSLDGSTGFKLSGVAAYDQAGISVDSAGDVNGDGFDDLIVGAFGSNSAAGAAYLVFGKASGFTANLDLSTLSGDAGFKLSGAAAQDRAGFSVSAAGDVNGDGYDDLLIGAYLANASLADSGAAYVVFGKAATFGANLNLSTLDGSNGFKLSGVAASDQAGMSVGRAGDLNGDGFADLVIGAPLADPNGSSSGASYVVFGKASGFAANTNLSTLDGSTGFKISGVINGDRSGTAVSAAGDVNGDGFDDLIIGAHLADPAGTSSGAAYVVFGKTSGFAANLNLSGLDGSNGFKLSGAVAGDWAGFTVSGAGDTNGDGFDDLLVGARYATPHGAYSGASYVVFGKATGFAANILLSALDGSSGFKIASVAAGDQAGVAVSRAGDVNGDGYDDLFVGASGVNGSTGAGYVVFGANFTNAVTFTGASGADLLNAGTAAAETFVSGQGADTLVGGGGADILQAGAGNDRIVVPDLAFRQADGGGGTDTLALTGAGLTLDLGNLGIHQLSDIEVIDLTGNGNQRLVLSAADLTHLPNNTNGLRIDGNAGDVVVLTDSWVTTITSIGLTNYYRLYQSGPVNLQVDTDVVVATATVALSSLNGFAGVEYSGGAIGDGTGASVCNAGDVNGDGFDDLIIGAPYVDGHGQDSGASYVVFGSGTVPFFNIALTGLDGTQGFKLLGAGANDRAGKSVSSAGDLNGDGFADLLIGAPRQASGSLGTGATYVVFGKGAAFAPTIELADLQAPDGFRIAGLTPNDLAGGSVSEAGDVNGDGYGDLLIRASRADVGDGPAGAVFVVFGNASGFSSGIDLAALDGSNGFVVTGAAQSNGPSRSVGNAGDVNGDGYDDIIIGADNALVNGVKTGAAYVVFGKAGGFAARLDVTQIGSAGFQLSGSGLNDATGVAVGGAGDVNGDGYDDMVIGSPGEDLNNVSSGSTYVVFGTAFFSTFNSLSAINGTNGFKLAGMGLAELSGNAVSGAGDFNGDGYGDLIVGGYGADVGANETGAAYLVYGKATAFSATLQLGELDGTDGFQLFGESEFDRAGRSVSGAGDVNGDGYDDLLIGTSGITGSHSSAYLVYGGNFSHAVTRSGTPGADTVDTGSAAAQTIVGSQGDDTLIGGGGADVVRAAEGDDRIVVADVSFRVVDGGSGTDTLALSGSQQFLNLAALPLHRLTGLEVIDLTGSGNNTLVIASQDLLHLSDTSNTLRVDGNAGDRVGLGDFWQPGGTVALGDNSYRIYTRGAATLQVDTDIAVGTANLALWQLDGSAGFRLTEASPFDVAGTSVSDAGDVNGDGYGDLIIGAPYADPHGDMSGAAYVVFGAAEVGSPSTSLTDINGGNGFKLSGVATKDRAGHQVSGAGDVNGDGFDDVIVSAPSFGVGSSVPGTAFVVFGKASGFAPDLELGSLDGANGFKLSGLVSDVLGSSIRGAGDINGDGFEDLIVGVPWAPTSGGMTGAAYVVFGKPTGYAPVVDLMTLDGSNGFRLSGALPYEYAGRSVSGAGDVNGDGFDDLVVGVTGSGGATGLVGMGYVVFGKASGFTANVDLQTVGGTTGIKLSEVRTHDALGSSVRSAGDVNGDGYGDLVLRGYDGIAYVVFGKPTNSSPVIDLSALDGVNGFQLAGDGADDRAGWSVSAAGDFNGDGIDDLLIGAYRADSHARDSGKAYIVFGKASAFAPILRLGELDGTAGVMLSGELQHELAGRSVSGGSDINGDGYDDVVIGAGGVNAAPVASYIVYGSNLSGAVSHPGSAQADSLVGGAGADRLLAMLGNDTLAGRGGADVLHGGPGVDVADYTASALAVQVDLSSGLGVGGDAQGDQLSAIENLWGSAGNDTLSGNALANALDGGAGNDTLLGRAGADNLSGGAGFDRLEGGDGDDTLRGAENADTLLGGDGNDLLGGGKGVDSLDGGAGDDTLSGAAGADILIGGDGLDLVDYSAATDAVVVNLTIVGVPQLISVLQSSDSLSGIERVRGSNLSDTLTGDAANNQLFGLVGHDTLIGNEGFDTLDGGDGNDLLSGGNNADALAGGSGDDTLGGGKGIDSLDGGDGNDSLTGALGADLLSGGSGADRFVFNAAVNGVANIDTILDFESGTDLILLSSGIFGAFAGQVGQTVGLDARLQYNPGTGSLTYDADGVGLGPALAFATLGLLAHPASLGSDFLIVA